MKKLTRAQKREINKAAHVNPLSGRLGVIVPIPTHANSLEDITPELIAALAKGMTPASIIDTLGIGVGTLYAWMDRHAEETTRARRLAADRYAYGALDAIDEIDDNAPNGAVRRQLAKAEQCRWLASRIAPKEWGDRVQQDVTVSAKPLAERSDAELLAIIDGRVSEANTKRNNPVTIDAEIPGGDK